MNDELKMYQKELSGLSKEEQKERNLYLRKLSLGEIQGPLTSYASIDRPWLQYYSDASINSDIPEMSIYRYLISKFRDNKEAICLEYYGNKVSRKKFVEMVDEIARRYTKLGVKAGDIVSIISVTTPELIYSIYALNKIGAISNIIDPRLSIDNLKEKCSHSSLILSLDLVEKKLKRAVGMTQKVIYYSISDSFPTALKKMYRLKSKIKINQNEHMNPIMTWNEFMRMNIFGVKDIEHSSDKDGVAIMVSTSGTTGPSKLAMLSNHNINTVAWEYDNSGIGHELGDVFLNIMPAFLSYGAVAGIHMPLTLGFKTVIIPKRELKDMGKYILKYKPQAYLDIPNGYEALRNDKRLGYDHELSFKFLGRDMTLTLRMKRDLSFLKNPGVGGDHLNTSLERVTNEFLRKHNNDNLVAKGYGMTEISSASVVNVHPSCNSLGSVGVPFVKTTIKIVNPETGMEVGYGEEGELYINTPAMFKGYYGNETATKNEISVDEQGIPWVKTGDLFVCEPNGELFFKGRKKTMFVRPDGHNNHPMEMTELILTHPAVSDAYTVGIDSPWDLQGKYPKSVIVLKDEYKGQEDLVQHQLEEACIGAFSQRDVPYFYQFRDALPYTPGGKIDYRLLENEGLEGTREAAIAIKEKKEKISTRKKVKIKAD